MEVASKNGEERKTICRVSPIFRFILFSYSWYSFPIPSRFHFPVLTLPIDLVSPEGSSGSDGQGKGHGRDKRKGRDGEKPAATGIGSRFEAGIP